MPLTIYYYLHCSCIVSHLSTCPQQSSSPFSTLLLMERLVLAWNLQVEVLEWGGRYRIGTSTKSVRPFWKRIRPLIAWVQWEVIKGNGWSSQHLLLNRPLLPCLHPFFPALFQHLPQSPFHMLRQCSTPILPPLYRHNLSHHIDFTSLSNSHPRHPTWYPTVF